MHKHKPLNLLPLLLACLPLLTSCVPKQQSLPHRLDAKAHRRSCHCRQKQKQPEPTPQCSPTCSDALQKKLDIMLSDLTKATGQMTCERIYDSVRQSNNNRVRR